MDTEPGSKRPRLSSWSVGSTTVPPSSFQNPNSSTFSSNTTAPPPAVQAPHHATLPIPYQPSHPHSHSHSHSFSRSSSAVPRGSPAPLTPLPANSYANSHIVSRPPPQQHLQQHAATHLPSPSQTSRLPYPQSHQHALSDDRPHHEQDQYGAVPDISSNYRSDRHLDHQQENNAAYHYRPDNQWPDHNRVDHQPEHRLDPRAEPRGESRPDHQPDQRLDNYSYRPGQNHRGLPTSPARHPSSYSSNNSHEKPPNEEALPQPRRPGSSASSQLPPPVPPSSHYLNDNRRQMSFDNPSPQNAASLQPQPPPQLQQEQQQHQHLHPPHQQHQNQHQHQQQPLQPYPHPMQYHHHQVQPQTHQQPHQHLQPHSQAQSPHHIQQSEQIPTASSSTVRHQQVPQQSFQLPVQQQSQQQGQQPGTQQPTTSFLPFSQQPLSLQADSQAHPFNIATSPVQAQPSSVSTAQAPPPPHVASPPIPPPTTAQQQQQQQQTPQTQQAHTAQPLATGPIYRPQPAYPSTPTVAIATQPAQSFDQAYSHTTPTAQTAELGYPTTYQAAGKKKAQRASQACDSCRALKAKCDETKPCKNCREKNIECKYRDPVPKQQDKVAADLLDGINLLRGELEQLGSFKIEMKNEFNFLGRRLTLLEKAFKAVNPNAEVGLDSAELDDSDGDPSGTSKDPSKGPATALDWDTNLSVCEAGRIVRQMHNEYRIPPDPGPVVPPGESAMPSVHTTLAGLLLTWPTIRERVQHLLHAEKIHFLWEYPIRQEEQRGNIRFYGQGEGFDDSTEDGPPSDVDSVDADNAPTSQSKAISNSSRAGSQETESSSQSPQPRATLWGHNGDPVMPTILDSLKGATARPLGYLDCTPTTVWKYVKSYEDHMQIMHPIIISRELHAMVTLFLEGLPKANPVRASSAEYIPVAQFAGPPDSPPREGSSAPSSSGGSLKRKRTPPAQPAPVPPPGFSYQRTAHFFQNIESALVLAVLALGKICTHQQKIPDLVPVDDAELTIGRNPQTESDTSPLLAHKPLSSPSPSSQHQQGVQPDQQDPPTRRASLQSQPQSQSQGPGSHSQGKASSQTTPPASGHIPKRNVDVIPGLDYFAAALQILSNHIGVRQLKVVWVLIICSLYYGQLNRPMQSLEYVASAGRHLQVILRPHLHRLGEFKRSMLPLRRKRDNQYTIAFWTCLQLERLVCSFSSVEEPKKELGELCIYLRTMSDRLPSDILAELHLPPSGLLNYEQQMPYPSGDLSNEQGYDDNVMRSYTAQLYLRNQLNDIHKNLYGPRKDQTTINMTQIKVFRDALSTHLWVPEFFRFSESDPPADNILAARLRAKFWGAQVIVHRFFVRRILEYNYNRRIAALEGGYEPDYDDYENEQDEDSPVSAISIELAKRGIKALVESTRPFHGLSDKRYIVTNIFGTAHAQWGNLLVLDSVQRDPILGKFISESLVNELFERTIDLFETVSQPNSALGYDLRILKGLYRSRQTSEQPQAISPAESRNNVNNSAMEVNLSPVSVGALSTAAEPPTSAPQSYSRSTNPAGRPVSDAATETLSPTALVHPPMTVPLAPPPAPSRAYEYGSGMHTPLPRFQSPANEGTFVGSPAPYQHMPSPRLREHVQQGKEQQQRRQQQRHQQQEPQRQRHSLPSIHGSPMQLSPVNSAAPEYRISPTFSSSEAMQAMPVSSVGPAGLVGSEGGSLVPVSMSSCETSSGHMPVRQGGGLPSLPLGSLKGPSTPSDSGFPHHLPPFDQPRRSFGGSE